MINGCGWRRPKQRNEERNFEGLCRRSLDCKTVSIFAYLSRREQSYKRSGTRLKTESETGERRPTGFENDCFAVYFTLGARGFSGAVSGFGQVLKSDFTVHVFGLRQMKRHTKRSSLSHARKNL